MENRELDTARVPTPLPEPAAVAVHSQPAPAETKRVVEESRSEFAHTLQTAPRKAGPAYGAWLASLHTAAIAKPLPRRGASGVLVKSMPLGSRQRMRSAFLREGARTASA
ncbi:hypothetical protein AURDEDRAFT_172985 [Auricularia subglabra TFB-10046 SS5]|uniref:Uncharacterized protein n=1 Tax=Auricularia subglabra (strain TFB-10046 / SS5) TaxID=717982 RepID=J0DBK4_AURST|nr:hypothetical protein AURDEDRAFT_172985 [Auricularia subglabra TFB-10046 SS5]